MNEIQLKAYKRKSIFFSHKSSFMQRPNQIKTVSNINFFLWIKKNETRKYLDLRTYPTRFYENQTLP
jgi:hypothetical protein